MKAAVKARKLLWHVCSAALLMALAVGPSAGWQEADAAAGPPGPIVVESIKNDVSPALRAVEPVPPEAATIREIPLGALPNRDKSAADQPAAPDEALQNGESGNAMPSPIVNFEGVNNRNGVLPPDTQGDVGPSHYVQWVNLSFQIFDKSGTSLYGPANGNTLWSGFGAPCQTANDGDPITLYDPLADRWLMSQFALPSYPVGPFYQCVAVSVTGDPTGAWYRYAFTWPGNKMNDYPKFGVWPDGYYMTVNQFASSTGAWAGGGVAVLERSKLLSGLPASMQYFDMYSVDPNFGGMLPSDLDGTPPPAGAPNYFAEVDDGTWIGPSDAMRLWRFHVDWATPANTTFGVAGQPNAILPVTNFTPICIGDRNCIPQPGTSQGLDAIGDRLMYRLAYRNFGTHQSLVVNHTVDAGSGRAGIRWYEVRDPGGTPSIYQQGTYAGDTPDTEHRWMGSVAMDSAGNIALGYSVSSGTVYPSIRYVGRLVGDPLGTLPQGEASLRVGSGSQTHSAARWGDYSMMAVDPTDDCTFWYTQEYIQTTGSAAWQTRIGSFKFPSCTAGAQGTLEGTVTNSSSGSPIAGAKIEVGASTTYTNGSGFYSIALPVGVYSVTASAYGFSLATVPGVAIVADTTTTQDFALVPRSAATIAGTVSDGSGHGWPLYASIDITSTGYSVKIFTDPVTGHYSIGLLEGESYTFVVGAVSTGYNAESRGVIPPAGGGTEDFALSVDAAACSAPGYTGGPTRPTDGSPAEGKTPGPTSEDARIAPTQAGSSTPAYTPLPEALVFSQGFEGGVVPPSGWSKVSTNASYSWKIMTAGTPHGGSYAADVEYDPALVPQDEWLVSPEVDLTSGTLSFWSLGSVYWCRDTYNNCDLNAWIVVGAPGGHDDIYIGKGDTAWPGSWTWAQSVFDITSLLPGGTVRIGFQYVGADGAQIGLDDISLDGTLNCSLVPGGLLVGNVYDANTDGGLNGATVASVSAPADTTTTFGTPVDTAVDDGFYILFSSLTGARNFTASMPGGYAPNTRSAAVAADSTVRRDFRLPAGQLIPTPTDFSVMLAPDGSTTRALTLDNTGGVAATFDIFEVHAPLAASPVGPFAEPHRHVGPKRQADLDARGVLVYDPPTAPVMRTAAGAVINTWASGLTYPWGIGFNQDADDLWLGNIVAGGGDDLNYRFLRDGTNTGDTIDTSPWVAVFGGDMTYNPFTAMLWQVNVGGDNCIYEMDPAAKTPTGGKICPAFGTSERGLAYDPLTGTFYSGSWNDGIINHFDQAGTILDSADVGLSISGLALNPVTGHLFVMTNAAAGFDVYVLDIANSYAVVGGFNVTGLGDNEQAGLELSCDGHLWAVNQTTKYVIEADSGETGVCGWQDIPWLIEAPISGSVAAAGSQAVTLTFDASGLAPGVYDAFLHIMNGTPYAVAPIPVRLTVSYSIFLPHIGR